MESGGAVVIPVGVQKEELTPKVRDLMEKLRLLEEENEAKRRENARIREENMALLKENDLLRDSLRGGGVAHSTMTKREL